jgi:predicted amidohydrolase YtcJ
MPYVLHAGLVLGGLAGLLACPALAQSTAGSRPADLVIYGRVWTGDSARAWAEAIAVAGDTIIEVGDSGQVARLVGSSTKVMSNGKAMVAPGFMDGHVHLLSGGFQIARVDLRSAS